MPAPLALLAPQVHASTGKSIAGGLVRWMQMMSFALLPLFSWHTGSIDQLRFALGITAVKGYWQFFDAQTYISFYYFSLIWAAIFVALVAWAMQSFVRSQFSMLWPLKVLRSIGSFSATVAYIPIFTLLMSGFQCDPHENPFWGEAGFRGPGRECFEGGHLAQSILSAGLTLAFFLLCCLFSLVFYDSNSMSTNITAKAHGRADFVFLCLKTVLVICVEVFPEAFPRALLVTLVVASSVCWLGSHIFFLPYFHHNWNRFVAAQAATVFYTSLCLTATELFPASDASIMLYFGLPFAAIAGVWATDWRATWILETPALRLSSPYEIEVKVRLVLHEAIWGHPTTKHSIRSEEEGQHGRDGKHRDATIDDAEGSDDIEIRTQAARRVIKPSTLNECHAIYRSATNRFRASSMLHVFFSRFYMLQGNQHMQMSHLLQAERRHPPVDIAFVVFQMRKMAEDGGGRGSSGEHMSALNRVTLEKYASDARKFVQKAANRQLAFWAELLDPQPDLSRLHSLSSEMNDAIAQAERAFTEIFAIDGQSMAMMRLYAAFNEYVCCNPDKASVLLQEAERIEDQKSKDRHSEGKSNHLVLLSESPLEIMTDSTAVLTIGGQPRNLGMILTANSNTSKAFGYSRIQLERRPFFTLLAPPLGGIFENMLRNYQLTGEGRIAATHVVLGLTKTGATVPMLVCIRETPADEGPPSFIALMREARSSDHYIVLNSAFQVLAGSSLSYDLMGIDASTLAGANGGGSGGGGGGGGAEAHITDFVVEWPLIVDDLMSVRGSSLCVSSIAALGQTQTLAATIPLLSAPAPSDRAVSFASGNAGEPASPSSKVRAERRNSALKKDDKLNAERLDGTLNSTSPAARRGSGTLMQSGAAQSDGKTFVHAHLQRVPIPTDFSSPLVTIDAPTASKSGHSDAAPAGDSQSRKKAHPLLKPKGSMLSLKSFASKSGALSDGGGGTSSANEGSGDSGAGGDVDPSCFYVLSFRRINATDTLTLSKAMRKHQALLETIEERSHAAEESPGHQGHSQSGRGKFGDSNDGASASHGHQHQHQHQHQRQHQHQHQHQHHKRDEHPHRKPDYHQHVQIREESNVSTESEALVHAGSAYLLMPGVLPQQGGQPASADLATPPQTAGERSGVALSGVDEPHSEAGPLPLGVAEAVSVSQVSAVVGAGLSSSVSSVPQQQQRKKEQRQLQTQQQNLASRNVILRKGSGVSGGSDSVKGGAGERKPFRGAEAVEANDSSDVGSSRGEKGSDSDSSDGEGRKRGSRGKLVDNLLRSAGGRRAGIADSGAGVGDANAGENQDKDGERDKDGKSVVSSFSSTSGTRTMQKLRRVLVDNKPTLLTGLWMLRMAGIIITLLGVALGVATAVIMYTNFTFYGSQVAYVNDGCLKLMAMFCLIINSMTLFSAAKQWTPFASLADEQIVRALLMGNASVFDELHRKMFLLMQPTSLGSSYTTPYIIVSKFDDSTAGINGDTITLNLYEAGAAVTAEASIIAHSPLANLTDEVLSAGGSALRYIMTNAVSGGSTHESIHSSLEVGYLESLSVRASVQSTGLLVFLSMASVLAGFVIFAFLPILTNIEQSKDAIVKSFVFLPRVVRINLHRQTERRVAALRLNFGGDDDENDQAAVEMSAAGDTMATDVDGAVGTSNDDIDWESIMARNAQPAASDLRSAPAGSAADKASRSAPVGGSSGSSKMSAQAALLPSAAHASAGSAASGEPAVMKRSPSWTEKAAALVGPLRLPKVSVPSKKDLCSSNPALRAYRKSYGSCMTLSCKFLGPIIGLVFFFTAVYLMSVQALASTLPLSSSIVAATNRALCTRESIMDLMRTLAVTQDRAYVYSQVSSSQDTIECVEYHQNLMIYGTSEPPRGTYDATVPTIENGNSPLLSAELNALIYKVQFGNACPFIISNTDSVATLAECEAWQSGLATQGVQGMVHQFALRFRRMLDRRNRARIFSDSPNLGSQSGHGFIAPVATYNYSADADGAAAFNFFAIDGILTFDAAGMPILQGPSPAPDFTVKGDVNMTDTGPPGSLPYFIGTELLSDDMLFLRQADAMYLTPALIALEHIYFVQTEQVINNYTQFIYYFVASFVSVFIVVMAFFFMPQVKATNDDIQKKRGMLLFLPPQVIRAVPSIRELIDNILAEDPTGLSASAARADSAANS